MNPLIVRTPLVQCGSICWVPTPKHRRTFSSSPRMTRPLHNHRPGGGPTPCSLPAPQGFPIQRGRAPTLNCTSLSKAGGSTRNLIGHNSSQHPSHPSPRRFNFEKKEKKRRKTWSDLAPSWWSTGSRFFRLPKEAPYLWSGLFYFCPVFFFSAGLARVAGASDRKKNRHLAPKDYRALTTYVCSY